MRRNWVIYLQLEGSTSKPDEKDNYRYLKGVILKKLGKHVYKDKGNIRGEYVARCKAHDNCTHLVKVGPGKDGFLKIMVHGEHSLTSKIKPSHGISHSLLERIKKEGQHERNSNEY